MSRKLIELFEGLMQGAIPFDGGGYVFSVRFHQDSNYTIFEIISYKNVKNIIHGESSTTFQSDGYKTFLVYEPLTFPMRHMEPYLREDDEKIPMRWNEVETFELNNRDRVFMSLEPYVSNGSFTVERPAAGSFVYYIYEHPDMDETAERLLEKILRDDFKITRTYLERIKSRLQANLAHFHKATENQ